jgi:Secretion system C-terminal sorting domain
MKIFLTTVVFLVACFSLLTGQVYFNNFYGDPNFSEAGMDIDLVPQGYIISGQTIDSIGYKYELRKIDTIGNEIWAKGYYSPGYSMAFGSGNNLLQEASGGFAVCGSLYELSTGKYSAWFMRFNQNGDTLFSRMYQDTADVRLSKCIQQNDGGFILGGGKKEFDGVFANFDFFLMKVDSLGNLLWKNQYHWSPVNYFEFMVDLVQDMNGDILMCGNSDHWADDVYLVKTDCMGNFLWNKFVGAGNYSERAHTIRVIPDGNIIIAGSGKSSSQSNYRGMVIKTDSAGNLIWKKTFARNENENELSFSIVALEDGKLIAPGLSMNDNGEIDGWIIKLDENGDSLWSRFYSPRGPNSSSYIYDLESTSDHGFITCGFFIESGVPSDFWVMKMDSVGCLQPYCGAPFVNQDQIGVGTLNPEFIDLIEEPLLSEFLVFPIPTSDQLNIRIPESISEVDLQIQIRDQLGREVIPPNSLFHGSNSIYIGKFPEGIYFVFITKGDQLKLIKKVSLLK